MSDVEQDAYVVAWCSSEESNNESRTATASCESASSVPVEYRAAPGICPRLKTHAVTSKSWRFQFYYEPRKILSAKTLPGAVPMANWPDLVAVPDIDVVWIGTPPYTHSAVTISALEAGKHVFARRGCRWIAPKPRKCWRPRNVFPSW